MPILNPNRGIYFASITETFNLSDSKGSFLRQNGVTIFYKNPATGALNSYQPDRLINSLSQIKKYDGYQIDNKSTSPIIFPDTYAGFNILPDLSEIN